MALIKFLYQLPLAINILARKVERKEGRKKANERMKKAGQNFISRYKAARFFYFQKIELKKEEK